MLSKSNKIRAFWRFRSQIDLKIYRGDVHPVNGMYNFLCNSFCNITVSMEVDDSTDLSESPELPNWVKFVESGIDTTDPKDDFVLPSVSHWVDSHKLHGKNVEVKSVVSNIVDSDVDKISRILKDQFESTGSVVGALNGCCVNVSKSLVDQVLKRFSNNWIPAFGFFKWAKMQIGYKHSPDSYNLMVDILGKSKMFDLMWEIVEEMDQLGGHITLITMAKVMRRLTAFRHEEAIEAFRRIDQFRVDKDVFALNTLMDTLVKDQKVEHAQNVYTEFKSQIAPNLRTFNILLHGWCKARQLEKAEKIIEEMGKHGFCPDVISYTCFVEAYCNEKDFRKVDATLEEMQEKGCPPNVVTYTIAMHALGKAKELNEALEVYEKMKRNGCVPDPLFYSSLIYILSKAGRVKDAQDVFEDMPKQGVFPDVWTYNTMISIACQHSQEEHALKLLQKMVENSCQPDEQTYTPLLKMCCRMKRMKMISFLLSHMLKNDVSVGLDTYSILVRGLCKSGKLEHACSFFEETVLRGFVPRNNLYKLLVKELEGKGMIKAKVQIEELMLLAKQQESTHSPKTLV